jgi:hypothetical protein
MKIIVGAIAGAVLLSWVTQHLIQNVDRSARDPRGDGDFMYYLLTAPVRLTLGSVTGAVFF